MKHPKMQQNLKGLFSATPLVSIIIPFFNRIKFLKESLESVLNQTYKNIEVILINDGSVEPWDNSIPIDPRIIFFEKINTGPAAARNLGIAKSHGNYIAFLDADDLLSSDKIEKQIALMEESRAALLSHTSYIYIDESGNKLKEIKSGKFRGQVYPKIFLHSPIATSTVMIRGEIKNLGLRFCEDVRIAEDTILWAQIAKISPILGLDEPLSKIRIHKNSTAKTPELRLRGGYNIYAHGIKKDQNLSGRFGNIELFLTYLSVAKLYLKNFNPKGFIKNFFLSSKYLLSALVNKNY